MEVLELEAEDIITLSNGDTSTDENGMEYEPGGWKH